MDSHASSPFQDTKALRNRIADVVSRSFQDAFADQCADRHGQTVTVERAAAESLMRLQVQCPRHEPFSFRLAVQHVGGNVYDVHCTMDEGPTQTFVYCLSGEPDSETPLALVPRLGHEIAGFVIDALEKSLGRRGLRPE